MPKARWSQIFAEYVLCLVAFTIPFPFIYSAISIGVLVLAWLLQLNFKDTFINLKTGKALWLWLLFFLLHAVSYFYSENKAQSAFDLEQKLSFVILPIVVGAGMRIHRQLLERLFFSFVAGITVIAMWCLGYAIWRWYPTGNTEVFFYHELISGLEANAVYTAWYCLFSISLLLFMPRDKFFISKGVKIAITFLQIVFFILLSSRMLIALFFVVIIPFYLLSGRLTKPGFMASTATMILLLSIIAFTKNPIRTRYENIYEVGVKQAFLNDYSTISEGDFSNLTLRIFLWRVGIMNMNEHDLWWKGTGNGDFQIYQNQKMEELGIRNLREPVYTSPLKNVNLHNMYLQSLIMLGLPGFITFTLISFLPLFRLKNLHYRKIFVMFHIIVIAFMMQEAALQTQAGVIFYTFFSMVFWNVKYRALNKKY